ncbi:MAG: hypothetical protein ABR511_00970 [Acidimicrobiales bacterium]
MSDQRAPLAGTTLRCPICQKLNRVPPAKARQARCGSCRAPLLLPPGAPAGGSSGVATGGGPGGPAARSGDLGRQVIERWDALLRLVPRGMALGRAVGRSGGDDPAADPVGWLSTAAHMPRDDLDQVRLLRIHLASNRAAPPAALHRALDALDRAQTALERTRLPE